MIALLASGNATAFRTLYDQQQQQVFAFAFYLTKSKEIAETTVQEVFMRIWERRNEFTPETSLSAYIKAMTQNYVLDIFRKAGRDKNLLEHICQQAASLKDAAAEPLLERELKKIISDAIRLLPPQQRIVYLLHRDENLSYAAIATALQLSRNTVRNHMAVAIQSVRTYVAARHGLGVIFIALHNWY